MKQLFDGKEKIQEILSKLGFKIEWKHVGIFYAQVGGELPLFDCENCSIFAILGEEELFEKLKKIEAEVKSKNKLWNPVDHVIEFVEID